LKENVSKLKHETETSAVDDYFFRNYINLPLFQVHFVIRTYIYIHISRSDDRKFTNVFLQLLLLVIAVEVYTVPFHF
jgi:hypothetical protein